MDSKRFLIVNADDFGLSEGVNRGIIEAHERGIVTSASLMVLKPAAASAAAYGREHLRLVWASTSISANGPTTARPGSPCTGSFLSMITRSLPRNWSVN